MKKTITLLLSIAVMVGCLAMPVVAGNNNLIVFRTGIGHQYQGSTFYDQGWADIRVDIMALSYIALVDSRGCTHGAKVHVLGGGGPQYRTITTNWLDHAYNNTSVDCHQHYY